MLNKGINSSLWQFIQTFPGVKLEEGEIKIN
jgi:hypothetical protein